MSSPSPKAWRCLVCGYVHHGDAPPDECPVCGAPAADFEPYEEPRKRARGPIATWRCEVCGYAQDSEGPPDECPVCGAFADQFAKVEPAMPAGGDEHGESRRIVIIGNGIAGVSAAEAARKVSASAEIVLVGDEPGDPYHRLNLTRLLADDVPEEKLPLHEPSWYDEQRIERLHARATAIDQAAKSVTFEDGSIRPYDRLVLATGARPRVPRMDGVELGGVYTLRTLADAQGILDTLGQGTRCVCIGGGILGLETAGALSHRGAKVTLLEGAPHLMPRQLPRPGSEKLAEFVRAQGISLQTATVTKALAGGDTVESVQLEGGAPLPADLVVIAIGVQSNTDLAEAAGLETSAGIVVDDLLRTSDPGIYGAGDSAEHGGVLYGNWAAAQYQGSIAGMNAAGSQVEFGGIPRSHTLKVLDVKMTSIGRFDPGDEGDRVIEEETAEGYRRFVFHGGKLVGAVLLGDIRLASAFTKAIESGRDCSGFLDAHTDVSRVMKAFAD